MGESRADETDREPEHAERGDERRSHGTEQHNVGQHCSERRPRIADRPEIALAGDHHRRVDDDAQADQRQDCAGRRPRLTEQERDESRCPAGERREKESEEDHSGGKDPTDHPRGISVGCLHLGHCGKGHAHQGHEGEGRRLQNVKNDAVLADDRHSAEHCGRDEQALVSHGGHELDRLDASSDAE
jgi:hypothetical protein